MSAEHSRAGTYVMQPAGYRAFIPRDLPPVPPIRFDDEMQELLSKADRALGRLDSAAEVLPDPDLFVLMYVRREAVLSSQIEGTQASLSDLLQYELSLTEAANDYDIRELMNYVSAMNYGLARLADLPVSLRMIREIHERLMDDVRGHERQPGSFRRVQNWVGPAGSRLENAEYVPPPPQELDRLLAAFEKFLHDGMPMPFLVKVGLAHAQFETLHPFLDGNGRIGRLLITFLLCERAVLVRPLLYLSVYLKQYRAEYYRRLQAIRDRGDWENWLKFFLRGVFEVAQDASLTARKVVRMREAHRDIVMEKFGRAAPSGLVLLEHLFKQPFVTAKTVTAIVGISASNANQLLGRMQSVGLLRELSGRRRNRIFGYQPYTELFTD